MPFRNLSGSSTATLLFVVALSLLTFPACSGGGFEAGQQAFDDGEYDVAMDHWMPLAEDGDAQAQFGVGYLYEEALGVPLDYKEAIHWYRLAAESGHASSQLNLGIIYMVDHDGMPHDLNRSADWFRMAADQGNPKAQYYLGKMYYRGEGLPENYELAFEWLSKAAEQKDPMALNHLGILYLRGKGVEQDAERAFELILSAAEMGNKSALLNVTTQYIRGNGTEQDFVEALKWYTIHEQRGPDATSLPMDWVDNNMSEEEIAEAKRRAEEWLAEHPRP